MPNILVYLEQMGIVSLFHMKLLKNEWVLSIVITSAMLTDEKHALKLKNNFAASS